MTWAPRGIDEGIAILSVRDTMFARIVETAGIPRFPLRPEGFGTLLHIILEQQVSIDAAATMYARLQQNCAPLVPRTFLELDDDMLRRCGFSRQKMAYGRNLAEAMRDGIFNPTDLSALEDEAALAELMKLKGIGRWTSEVYLLFVLGRPDVWPAGDLALQLAIQRFKGLAERPDHQVLREMAEAWRPWRGVAACLLWQYYLYALGRLPAAVA